MRRDLAIAKLKAAETALRSFGVSGLFLFGSHARDEAGPLSDIDVFVDFEDDVKLGFVPYMDALDVLKNHVDAKIDYGTRAGLHPALREKIEQEAVRIF